MASAIFFGGRRINVPGAYSTVDGSALASISPSAVGIVALVGTAEGGKPLTCDAEFVDSTRADALREKYRSGDLLTAGLFAFEPSADEAVPFGANRIVGLKVNPATQSTLTLADDSAGSSVVLTSADWGLFTAQINLDVDTGTTQGKKIVIAFEEATETFDDVGGDAIMTIDYTPGSNGYSAITGAISAAQFVAAATKTATGLGTDRTAVMDGTGTVTILSSDVGDVGQTVIVYGIIAGNAPSFESFLTNGTTPVVGTTVFLETTGITKSAATTGTITARSSTPTTLWTLAPATLTKGLSVMTAAPVSGVITLDLDAASAGAFVVVRGTTSAGAVVTEYFDVSAGTAVVGIVATIANITQLELGDLPNARTLTLTCSALATSHATYTTVQKTVDRINASAAFTANALVSNPTTFLMTSADYAAAVSILATGSFYADTFAFIESINDGSQYITAARSTGGSLRPANTSAALYLTGGIEGAVTITQWQEAFSLLRKRRVNIIVPLTNDPAVHALLLSHLVERAGRLRSEANGYVGLGTGVASETYSNIVSQIQTLQSRHLSFLSQEVKRSDPADGVATWYPPHMLAAIAAGMQAGSAIGEPLTRKKPLAIDIRNDSSWSVEDDVEDLIDRGLMMAENVDEVGVRFIRSITGHLADDNVVFTEMSANEACNKAVYDLRARLELKIGQKGAIGSAAALKSIASGVLGEQIDDGTLVAWRALQVEQVGDVFPISVEIAPVLPINFIPVTVHLVAVRVAA